MKIAGRKNAGAWARTNLAIQRLPDEDRANLAGMIVDPATCPSVDQAFAYLIGMQAELGITNADFPTTKAAWATKMCDDGIPLGVWMGKTSFTTYARTGAKGAREYTPSGVPQMRTFGFELRRLMKRYFWGRRALKDLFNVGTRAEGNPSGFPDGTPAT